MRLRIRWEPVAQRFRGVEWPLPDFSPAYCRRPDGNSPAHIPASCAALRHIPFTPLSWRPAARRSAGSAFELTRLPPSDSEFCGGSAVDFRSRDAADFLFHDRRGPRRRSAALACTKPAARSACPVHRARSTRPGSRSSPLRICSDGARRIPGSVERTRQRAISFRLCWRKADRFARGTRRSLRIAFREVCRRQIHVRLKKIGTKIERGSKLHDRGIVLFLREQYPAERVVRLGLRGWIATTFWKSLSLLADRLAATT